MSASRASHLQSWLLCTLYTIKWFQLIANEIKKIMYKEVLPQWITISVNVIVLIGDAHFDSTQYHQCIVTILLYLKLFYTMVKRTPRTDNVYFSKVFNYTLRFQNYLLHTKPWICLSVLFNNRNVKFLKRNLSSSCNIQWK